MAGTNKNSVKTVEQIPQNSIGAEIGVWKGDSSELFLQKAKHLTLVDAWSTIAYEESQEFDTEEYYNRYKKIAGGNTKDKFEDEYEKIYKSVVKRFDGKPVTIKRMTSTKFFNENTQTFDWIYVDGDHSYEGCLNDLRNSLKIIKTGGYIFGDDYGNKKDVVKAVDQFIRETNLPFDNFYANQFKIKVQ